MIRYVFGAALAASAAVLVLRAIGGPFRLLGLPVNSPLNAQSILGLSAVILLLLNSRPEESLSDGKPRHAAAWLLAILLLTLAMLWPAIRSPLLSDDYTLVGYARTMNEAYVKYYFFQGGGDVFFRPVGMVSLALDAIWSGSDSVRWHLLGLALHLANVVLVWLLARRFLGDRSGALWAAALFAVHATVLQTAAYLAARFDVLAAFFVLAGLVLFQLYLEKRRVVVLAASFLCAFLGLLTKEIAFSFPILAVLLSGPLARAHWRVLAGYFGLTAAVFVYRYSLLGGIGGYLDPATGAPTVLRPNLWLYLKGFGMRVWSVFYFPVNWSRSPAVWLIVALLAGLCALIWLALKARGSRRKLVLTLAFTTVALLPIAHLLLVDAGIWGAGRFYLASCGFALFLAAAIRSTPRRGQAVVGAMLLVFQIAALRHNVRIWSDIAAVTERTCTVAARSGALRPPDLPIQIDGVPFLRNGYEPCLEFYRARQTTGHLAP